MSVSISDKCRHVFYFRKNDCWYCDMSMMPVDEDCKMACFTNRDSEHDNATDLMNYLSDNFPVDDLT